MTYKEIGDKMCCSPRTVEGYRNALFEKLELHTRVGLALFAVKHGIFKF
jgi:DNA-binding NarL/FixJ family response regulator